MWSFYIKMCIGHAKIFIFSNTGELEKTAETEANSPVYHTYRPVYHSYCQIVRSGQPTGVLIPVVYLFGEEESKLRTRRSHTSTRNTENTASLYWFGPSKSNTLRPVVSVDCLRIGWGDVTWGIASSALYWPADEVSSQTPGRLRPGDLSLRYTSCHIPSICFGWSPLRSLSCTSSLEVVLD
jgi:hypothetical protein